MSATTTPPRQPPPAPTGGAPAPPPPPAPAQPPPREPWRLGKRVLIGGLVIAALAAAVVVAFFSKEVTNLRTAIGQNPSLAVAPGTLASAGSGSPQTLLLVGDDRRALTPYYHHAVASHSNEMLLVRFDPSKPWISMLSIPRELWVPIQPRNGPPVTNRINYAYTLGGTQLMTETIKRVTGLSVNHVVVIDFGHFKRAVDKIGCVYSTIDHRYYHSNLGSAQQYQEIDLQPGYQKLCGIQALQFVSYRHDDTSLIRDARNQSFLLDVKKEFGPTLVNNRGKFERVFGQAVQTDPSLHTTSGLLNLLTLLIQSAGRTVRQVHFQVNLLPSYDTATPQQIHSTVKEFLYGNSAAPRRHTAAVAHAISHHHSHFRAHLALVPTSSTALAQARAAAPRLPFPLEYPRVANGDTGADPDMLRVYSLRDLQGHVHQAYVAAVSRGRIGQYYDVQGTGWTTAPIFDSPDQTVTIGARTYFLYYDRSTLRMVAWHEYGAVYWVRNTLTDDVPNSEMLAIAEETYPLVGVHHAAPARKLAGLGAFGLPPRRSLKRVVQSLADYAPLFAVLAWIGLALLGYRVLVGRRELVGLRDQLALAVALDSHQRSVAADLGVSLGGRARALSPPRRSLLAGRRGVYVAITGLLALAAVGAVVGVVALGGSGRSRGATAARARAAARPKRPPLPAGLGGVGIAVLNASSRTGAAHTVATQLTARGLDVSAVGNVAATGQPGSVEVLYAAGYQQQAGALAQIVGSTTLAPMDPGTSSAAGGRALVVVLN